MVNFREEVSIGTILDDNYPKGIDFAAITIGSGKKNDTEKLDRFDLMDL